MSDTDREDGDWDLAQLLRAAGPRRQPEPRLKEEWEQQFRNELAPIIAARRQRRRRRVMALCAGVAALAIGIGALLRTPPPPLLPLTVVHVDGGAWLQGAEEPLRTGAALPAEAVLVTGSDGRLAVSLGGHEIRFNVDTQLAVGPAGVELAAGEIFVRDLPTAGTAGSLKVVTPHGSIEDVGTQFTVALSANATRTTVRDGRIRIDSGSALLWAEPSPGSASQVVMGDDGTLNQQNVSASGTAWDWVYRAAPEYRLEGSSAYEFLQWAAAERGLQLEFASPGAEIYAHSTLLHGELGTLTAETALGPVLATTDLRAPQPDDNRLRVYLQPR